MVMTMRDRLAGFRLIVNRASLSCECVCVCVCVCVPVSRDVQYTSSLHREQGERNREQEAGNI